MVALSEFRRINNSLREKFFLEYLEPQKQIECGKHGKMENYTNRIKDLTWKLTSVYDITLVYSTGYG